PEVGAAGRRHGDRGASAARCPGLEDADEALQEQDTGRGHGASGAVGVPNLGGDLRVQVVPPEPGHRYQERGDLLPDARGAPRGDHHRCNHLRQRLRADEGRSHQHRPPDGDVHHPLDEP
ncbi:unnamed protein product, partial [Effrenium voratum]